MCVVLGIGMRFIRHAHHANDHAHSDSPRLLSSPHARAGNSANRRAPSS